MIIARHTQDILLQKNWDLKQKDLLILNLKILNFFLKQKY